MATAMMESLFRRSLQDLVKGLRVQRIGESAFLAKALDEVRKELKSTDIDTKSVALQKLSYLNMLQGTDMGWASFHVVEVMSMQKFSVKKLGYFAASQSFNDSTDVLVLITNLLRKDFGGNNVYEASLAIECLSRVATTDLARDLLPDLLTTLASGRTFVRKKATAALWRVFTQYPDAIRVALRRLTDSVGDGDPSVVTAAISVLCDLAAKDPKSFLPLAPEIYNLLVRSSSNWLCIKLVKILGLLVPLEPRLGKKIADPICELLRTSEATSLLLECIQIVSSGLTENQSAVMLCVEKLNRLLTEEDTNVKYLCLRALANLMPLHPWAVAATKEAIAICLHHKDPSLQKGARRLIIGMISEGNVMATVRVLLQCVHSTDADSSQELLSKILSTCSCDHYVIISDFSWYVSILVEMARIPDCECGDEIGRQLIDIGFRVKSAIGGVLRAVRDLLLDPALLDRASVQGVLSAAAWIAGEYASFSCNLHELVEALLQPRTMCLPVYVRALYLHAVVKIFVYCSSKSYSKGLSSINGSTGTSCNEVENLPLDEDTSEAESSARRSILESEPEDLVVSERDPLTTLSGSGSESMVNKEAVSFEAGERSTRRCGVDKLNLGHALVKKRFVQTAKNWHHETDVKFGEGRGRITGSHLLERGINEKGQQGVVGALKPTIELITENMTALVTCSDVEVQERACNLLGLLQVFKAISSFSFPYLLHTFDVEDFVRLLDALSGILTVELSPASMHAQGRVAAPEDLILENLNALGPTPNNQEVTEGFIGRDGFPKWGGQKAFSFHGSNNSAVGQGAALLAQHRQLYHNFYLPSDGKLVNNSFGYPLPLVSYLDPVALLSTPATGSVALGDGPKPSRLKVRPVVVKLDDEEAFNSSLKCKKKDLKDGLMSSAIMDMLSGCARSSQMYESTCQHLKGGESLRKLQHRPHGSSRSLRRLGKSNGFNYNSSLRVKDGSTLEQEDSLRSYKDGKTSILVKGPTNAKFTRRHRRCRYERKEISNCPTIEDEPQGSKSLRSP